MSTNTAYGAKRYYVSVKIFEHWVIPSLKRNCTVWPINSRDFSDVNNDLFYIYTQSLNNWLEYIPHRTCHYIVERKERDVMKIHTYRSVIRIWHSEWIGVPSECHQNAIRMPSECHPSVIRVPPECHPNAIRVPLECRSCIIKVQLECHQCTIRVPSEWNQSGISAASECHQSELQKI